MKKLLKLACASLLASGCAVSSDHEPLYGIEVSRQALFVDVRSTGCTQADDFKVIQQDKGIEVSRLRADNCRRRPFVKRVKLKIPQDINNKRLLNPLFLGL